MCIHIAIMYVRYIFNSTCKSSSSWCWKGTFATESVVSRGACFRVGDGTKVSTWEDGWVPNNPGFKAIPHNPAQPLEARNVSSLKQADGNWDMEQLAQLFDDSTISNILRIHWAPYTLEDGLRWVAYRTGQFTVKSASHIVSVEEMAP